MEKYIFEKSKAPKKSAMNYFFVVTSVCPLIFLIGLVILNPDFLVLKAAILPFAVIAIYCLFVVFYIKNKRHKEMTYWAEDGMLCIAYGTKNKRSMKFGEITNICYRCNDDGSGDIFVNHSKNGVDSVCIMSVQAGFSYYEKNIFSFFDLKDVLKSVKKLEEFLPPSVEFVQI